ncbi:MAG: aldo/keto reductase [Sedimentisphaerales bacterium]|nr:aldo/keto reductase [Sedimentisphaerales bacterium]
MKRRTFLKTAGGVAGTYALGARPLFNAGAAGAASTSPALPRRVLGRTGEKISIVGFPGLALAYDDQQRCTTALHDAFDRGVNYFDVAPAYGQGDAEIKMGIGLQGIDRSRIFLACKTKMRDKDGARLELQRSLQRLRTDHFDLYQMHHIRTPDEVKQALGPGGAMETFLKAKEEGKVRYLGFSAHTTKGALEALNGYKFDTVMFPINFIEFFQISFGKAVLEKAQAQGTAVLAIKPMCGGAWPSGAEHERRWWYRPLEGDGQIDKALRFTLSQEGVVAAVPPSSLEMTAKAIEVATKYHPIGEEETAQLQQIAQQRLSLFQRDEQRVAFGAPTDAALYPDSPHECGRDAHA